MSVKVNAREHKDFKRECLEQDLDMSEVVRALVRQWMGKKKVSK